MFSPVMTVSPVDRTVLRDRCLVLLDEILFKFSDELVTTRNTIEQTNSTVVRSALVVRCEEIRNLLCKVREISHNVRNF